jgi:hypothetical protein
MNYGSFKVVDANAMAQLMQRATGKPWVGIGVDPNGQSGSLEAVLGAARQSREIPVNLDAHVVFLREVWTEDVGYFDPARDGEARITIRNLRSLIRSAAVPREVADRLVQTRQEQARALEKSRG